MGYTHGYSRSKAASVKNWGKFTNEVKKLLSHPAVSELLCEDYDKPNSPPLVTDAYVSFNGKGENGHETFFLERQAHKSFCKTGGIDQTSFADSWGKHYDIAVCAVLVSAKRHLREEVSSDGDWDDEGWMRARALYAKVASFISPPLWTVKSCVKCHRSFAADRHSWGGYESCKKCKSGSYSSSSLGTVCSTCGAVNSIGRVHPLNWCWYCSQGYQGKEDAAADIAATWSSLMESLKELPK